MSLRTPLFLYPGWKQAHIINTENNMTKGKIHSLESFGTVDGPGVRYVVFVQGCPMRCLYCHNPDTWPMTEGTLTDPQEIIDNFERNRPFYTNGGITVTGGEPLMQAKFLCALADELKGGCCGGRGATALPTNGGRGATALPIHLALETSGYAPEAVYREVVERMDLVFQDLQHPDPAEHKRWTGVDPAPIHANLAWLKASGRPFIARIPLIPGVNDSDAAKEGFARLLEGAPGLLRVELLPYHLTAAAKYPFTGRAYDPGFDPTTPLNKETAAFERHGLPVIVM